MTGEPLNYCRGWPNQHEVKVNGIHFIQEDSADEIGEATVRFVEAVRSE